MKHDLQRRRYAEEARRVTRRQTAQPLEGMPSGNLKPWREVVTPHRDVASGEYQQAEFAADLHQVWRGEAEDEYGKPEEFFRRTFLTEGLRDLLLNAARRLRGEGGDPVVELQTNFGGGKTHSLIALYHLAGGYEPAKLPGRRADARRRGRRRAAGGAAGGARRADDRPRLAAAEAGRDDGAHAVGRARVAARRRGGVRARRERGRGARRTRASALITLLERYSPCLILIDEWVAYARQLYGRDDLAGGHVRHADDVRAGALGRGEERRRTRCSSSRSRRRTSRSAARRARRRSSGSRT